MVEVEDEVEEPRRPAAGSDGAQGGGGGGQQDAAGAGASSGGGGLQPAGTERSGLMSGTPRYGAAQAAEAAGGFTLTPDPLDPNP